MTKSFVLLSGGIDSTTALAIAIERTESRDVTGIAVDYGQRHVRELVSARTICEFYDIEFVVKPLHSVIPRTMLTDERVEVPKISYADIEGVSPTYVPFRNGLLISAVTAHVHGMLTDESETAEVYVGVHAEDAQQWAYPDCTPEFMGAMGNAVYVGTYRQVRLCVPLQWLFKHQIVALAASLNAPLHLTWSCYVGGAAHCGQCPTCRARRAAFKTAGIPDPTEYEGVPA
jgi:7-cyano-7-deazaguanine synthase